MSKSHICTHTAPHLSSHPTPPHQPYYVILHKTPNNIELLLDAHQTIKPCTVPSQNCHGTPMCHGHGTAPSFPDATPDRFWKAGQCVKMGEEGADVEYVGHGLMGGVTEGFNEGVKYVIRSM